MHPRAPTDRWTPPDLRELVALVTGASRGVGRGIALVLGECGATVYLSGRPGRSGGRTVETTAEEVTAAGGAGVAVPTDHRDDAQVEALFERVLDGSGRIDLAVVNAWGGYERAAGEPFEPPLWEQPPAQWERMVDLGLRSHYTSARLAARAMVEAGRGTIVFTGGWDRPESYLGSVVYDLVKHATHRLVLTLARELRPHGVAAVGVYPGFTRTEAVLDAFASAGNPLPPETHSPQFVGRAVARLAAAPDPLAHSGSGEQAAALARRFGFTDVDGREIEPFVLPDSHRLG